jgi:hypothetical protein
VEQVPKRKKYVGNYIVDGQNMYKEDVKADEHCSTQYDTWSRYKEE